MCLRPSLSSQIGRFLRSKLEMKPQGAINGANIAIEFLFHTRCYAVNLWSSMKYAGTSDYSILPNSRGFLLFCLLPICVFLLIFHWHPSWCAWKLVQDHGQSWQPRICYWIQVWWGQKWWVILPILSTSILRWKNGGKPFWMACHLSCECLPLHPERPQRYGKTVDKILQMFLEKTIKETMAKFNISLHHLRIWSQKNPEHSSRIRKSRQRGSMAWRIWRCSGGFFNPKSRSSSMKW